ncbi:MAG: tRNA (adenosine(37)-N6)-threonylcarbamoyltransferase complex dimerization subunit type 1 TsaB [Rikenellaceae bacterium]
MSLILCIETGTDVCSVALSKGGVLLSLRESTLEHSHGEKLAVFVEEMFSESKVDIDTLDAVAVGMGPGSYTGLRIGVSLAKGISYALGVPLIAVGSLDSMVCCALQDIEENTLPDISDDAILAPMIDAMRMEVYSKLFDAKGKSLSEVKAVVVEKDTFKDYREREFVIFGDGASKCVDMLSSSMSNVKLYDVAPSARGLVGLAYEKWKAKDFVDVAYFEPLYLKNFIGHKSKYDPLAKRKQ